MKDLKDNLINSLNELLERLEAEKQELEDKIGQLEKNIVSLNSLDSKVGPHRIVEIKAKRRRRPRGANLNLVRNFLSENPDKRFSVPEISDSVKIPRTSCWATLGRLQKKGVIEKDIEGYWKAAQQ